MILISGSIAHDYIMNYDGSFADHILADQLPLLSMGFGINALEKYHGGTGHNIAYALGLLGAKDETIMIGTVGKDFVAPHEAYINYGSIEVIPELNTATGFIFSDKHNNQITPFYPGAMALAHTQKISEICLRKFAKQYSKLGKKSSIAYAIISPNDTKAMIEHLQECKDLGIITIFDPGQALHFMSNEDLSKAGTIADMLIMNEYERALRKEKTGLDEHNPNLATHTIIITLGEKGVMYYSKSISPKEDTNKKKTHELVPPDKGDTPQGRGFANQEQQNKRTTLPARPCSSVLDPTGAGDAFRGGLLFGFLQGKSLEESIQIGQKVARSSLQSQGAQNYRIES